MHLTTPKCHERDREREWQFSAVDFCGALSNQLHTHTHPPTKRSVSARTATSGGQVYKRGRSFVVPHGEDDNGLPEPKSPPKWFKMKSWALVEAHS